MSASTELPCVLASTVVRGARKGDAHGGLYVVDLAFGEQRRVLNWREDIDFGGRGGDRQRHEDHADLLDAGPGKEPAGHDLLQGETAQGRDEPPAREARISVGAGAQRARHRGAERRERVGLFLRPPD